MSIDNGSMAASCVGESFKIVINLNSLPRNLHTFKLYIDVTFSIAISYQGIRILLNYI